MPNSSFAENLAQLGGVATNYREARKTPQALGQAGGSVGGATGPGRSPGCAPPPLEPGFRPLGLSYLPLLLALA